MPDRYGFPIRESERATQTALKAEQRKPDDADRPQASVLPGPKAKALPGQLSLLAER